MIRPASLSDILYICHKMRQRDLLQLPANGWPKGCSMDEFAAWRMKSSTAHYTMADDVTRVPICCFGATATNGVAVLWMLGTDAMETMTPKGTRELIVATRKFIRGIMDTGLAHRVESHIIKIGDFWEKNLKWSHNGAKSLLDEIEISLKHSAGANCEDIVVLAIWR